MRKIITLTAASLLAANLHAQAPAIEWQKCLGGELSDVPFNMKPVPSGGYIIAGQIETWDVDCLVVKTDGMGNVEWQKTYGGSDFDRFNAIEPTADGGYIATGYTDSSNGDVTGNHGFYDIWIVKLDNIGNIQWQKCLGGSAYDVSYSIYPSTDGYIVTGSVLSTDGDINPAIADSNNWVVKLNETGNIQWQKFISGVAYSVKTTSDGGYIMAGEIGTSDFYILKLNSLGNTIWQKNLGGSSYEYAQYINTTPDGGYIVAGGSRSNDDDVTVNHGSWDGWIVKLNELGDIQWQKSLGGSQEENMPHISLTSDGGYITTTGTLSTDGDITLSHGNDDCWIVKLSVTGDIQWQKSIGGSAGDVGISVYPTEDGGYIVGGRTESNDGDVSSNHGMNDVWLVKLKGETAGLDEISSASVLAYPNPAKDIIYFGEELKTVEVFTVEGKKVLFENNSTHLDVSNLQLGTYIVRMQTAEGKVATQKIIKN